MADIFISYKREDQTHAKRLADAFEEQGWTVWWDPQLRAGERFDDVIEEALTQASCVVVIWSKRSIESTYVRDEATYALSRNKLVPVKIEPTEVPFRFEGIHTPQLFQWNGTTADPIFQSLVRDIREVAGPAHPSGAPRESTSRVEANTLGSDTRPPRGAPWFTKTQVAIFGGLFVIVLIVVATTIIERHAVDSVHNDPAETMQQSLPPTSAPTEQSAIDPDVQLGKSDHPFAVILPGQPPETLSSSRWKEVQVALNQIGFDAGAEDGMPDAKTRNAILLFQQSRGYPATSELTETQRGRLFLEAKQATQGKLRTGAGMTSILE